MGGGGKLSGNRKSHTLNKSSVSKPENYSRSTHTPLIVINRGILRYILGLAKKHVQNNNGVKFHIYKKNYMQSYSTQLHLIIYSFMSVELILLAKVSIKRAASRFAHVEKLRLNQS